MERETIKHGDLRYLDKVQASAARTISALPDEFVYHNIKYFKRLAKKISKIAERSNLSQEDTESVLIAAWMLGVIQEETNIEIEDKKLIFNIPEKSLKSITMLLSESDYPEQNTEKVLKLLEESVSLPPKPQYEWERVFFDALASDYAGNNGGKRLEQTYKELLSRNVELSKKSWYELIVNYLSRIEYYTDYGNEQIKPAHLKLMKEVLKDKNNYKRKRTLH
ncbi:MAG: hypothetical protein IPL46_02505 [Saprospiraceae bacterium]|nr:hypothetical protein [Saprospiraceae bacterium]